MKWKKTPRTKKNVYFKPCIVPDNSSHNEWEMEGDGQKV